MPIELLASLRNGVSLILRETPRDLGRLTGSPYEGYSPRQTVIKLLESEAQVNQ